MRIVAFLIAFCMTALPTFAKGTVQNPDFALVQKHLDPGGVMYVYLDTDRFFGALADQIDGLANLFSEGATPEEQEGITRFRKGFRTAYPMLGLDAIQGFGSSTIRAEDNGLFINRQFLHLAKERKGAVALLAADARKRGTLNFAPANTVYYCSFDVKPGDWMALIRQVGEGADGVRGKFRVEQAFSAMDAATAMPINKILDSIDGEISFAVSVDTSKTVHIPSVPNGDKVNLPRPDVFITVATESPLFRDALIARTAKEGMTNKEVQKAGLTMTVLGVPEIYTGFATTIAHDGTNFYLSSDADSLAEAIERMKNKKGGLADNKEFQELMEGFPVENNSLTFVSSNLTSFIQSVVEASLPEGSNVEQTRQRVLALAPLYGVHQYVSVRRTVADGIEWSSRDALDGRIAIAQFAELPIGLLTGTTVPSLLRARDDSRRNACQENLALIDSAKQQWALENGKPPTAVPTWDDLLGSGKYLRTSPVCPADGVYAINAINANPSCSLSSQDSLPHVFPGEGQK